MQKKVSIVIPAYNVAPYIGASLRSVIGQTYRNIEILVVNDGSTDATAYILSEFAKIDDRIILISQENKGLAGARNTGITHATGDYICILDSDDIMLPKKIERQMAWMEMHPLYDFTYSDMYHFFDGTHKIYHHPMPAVSEDTYTSLLYGNSINPNTVFFRKSVYEKCGGFDDALRSAEDWDYWLTIFYAGTRCIYQPERLTLYRVRQNSLSADTITMLTTPIRVLQKQLLRTLSEEQKNIVEERLQYWYTRLYIAHLRKGAIEQARTVRSNISGNTYLLAILALVPVWMLSVRHAIIRKMARMLRFNRVRIQELEVYLRSL